MTAFSSSFYFDHPLAMAPGGVRTPFGVVLPPGGRVAAYVRSGGPLDQGDTAVNQNLVTTLSEGLKRVRSGVGDTVVCLPGHAENVVDNTMLTNLVAGTNIIGVGWGDHRPAFTWTATASQWVMNKEGVTVSNCKLNLAGANGVVKAIAMSGGNNRLSSNQIILALGATTKATIGIELAAGAAFSTIDHNEFWGAATVEITDGIKIIAANVVRILGNTMIAAATVANGLIHVTTASNDIYIAGNRIFNTLASSESAIVVDAAASTGIIADNYLGTKSSSASQPLRIGAGADLRLFNNLATDTGGASTVSQSGIVNPPGVTL